MLEITEERYNRTGKRVKGYVEIEEDMSYYWTCFWDLNSTRSVGFGVSGITFQEMDVYCRIHEIEDEDRDEFWELIRYMDNCFRSVVGENEAERSQKGKGKDISDKTVKASMDKIKSWA